MKFLATLYRSPQTRGGLIILTLVLAIALCAPLLSPEDPYQVNPNARLLPPLATSQLSAASGATSQGATSQGATAQRATSERHLLGTD